MDLNAIKARLAQLNSKGKKGSKLWKPSDEHDVRLLRQPNSDDPFVELSFHGNIGANFPFLCPENFNEECSICDFAKGLASWRDENGKDKPEAERKADFEIFKKIQKKPRYFVAMVERGKEDVGAQYWSVTDRVYQALLAMCVDEEMNSGRNDGGGAEILVSETEGYDVHVSYKKPGEKGNKTTMTLTDVKEKKKPTPLLPKLEDAKKLVASVGDVNSLNERISTAEADKRMRTWMNSGATEDTAQTSAKKDLEYGDKKVEEKPVVSQNAEKLVGKRSVDDALNDLIGG